MSKSSAIGVHMDAGFSHKEVELAYGPAVDRLLKLADLNSVTLTFFVLGGHMKNKTAIKSVKRIIQEGHEVANHSMHHIEPFGRLSYSEMREEIKTSHEKIAEVSGIAPLGFTAPGWSATPKMYRILREEGYQYDASVIPFCMRFFLSYLLFIDRQKFPYFSWDSSYLKRRGSGPPTIIPFPRAGVLRIPLWHTGAFYLSRSVHRTLLRDATKKGGMLYILHTMDILSPEEISLKKKGIVSYWRSSRSLNEKKEILRDTFRLIKTYSERVLKCRDLAAELASGKSISSI